MSNSGHDPAANTTAFAAWFDYYAKQFKLSDFQLAEKYYKKLRHLMRPGDDRKSKNGKPAQNQSQITAWRTGKKIPGPDVAYRLGRALQELGAPVSGLDALIAGHHFIDLLGTVGSHISIGIARSKPVFHPFAPEIAHVAAMLDKLAPRISRELTIRKLELGISHVEVQEIAALQAPLPVEELYPKEQTPLVDDGFVAWAYNRQDAHQKLPPTFAAAIALVENPTPEVVELAADLLANPHKDIMSLLGLGTPRWVLRACGDDHPPEQAEPGPEPDYTALNNFFDTYEAAFSLPGKFGRRRSATYPDVDLKLCQSEWHVAGTAVDIDYLLVDGGNRSQKISDVLDFIKQLAGKHELKLIAWPADEADVPLYRRCGFVPCRAWHAAGRRIEWPRCAHQKGTKSE